jgi:Fic family protein
MTSQRVDRRFDPSRPHNELPLLPPKAELETTRVLKKALSAGRALAELKGFGATLPDPSILVNSIVLQEAKASSEIENIVTTHDALYRALSVSLQPDPATKEVLRYREALRAGIRRLLKRGLLTTNLFIELAQTIRQTDEGIRKNPGTKITNQRTGAVIYTPPQGEERLRGLLGDLEQYIHRHDATDPLIKMAVTHYQFEAIHPFNDGNGRVGRILNILFLVQQGLLDQPILYLSRFIIERKADYYRLLKDVTARGEWEPWVMYMLDAVEATSKDSKRQIDRIRELMARTAEKARASLPPRMYSKDLLEVIFRQPYTKVLHLVELGIAERKTAAVYLRALESAGILKSVKVGREVLYLNQGLYRLLSD